MRILKQFLTSFFAVSLSFSAFANFTELQSFGANPGSLAASYFSPQPQSSALVVLLHGCAQNGEQLAQQSGLLGLAKKHKFALLVPQQGLGNNIKRCFNWYSADDYRKDKGESLSLKNMITHLKQQLASENIYILGLSAGGAMASSMLVNYPELFSAGAVVAGIPYPCADGLITAISCMKNGPSQTSDELKTLVIELYSQANSQSSSQSSSQLNAQPNSKPKNWPRLSVWTGENDGIVHPSNATLLAQQWTQLMNIKTAAKHEKLAGYQISQWQNDLQQPQVELVQVANLGHGIMVNPSEKNGGEISDYLLAAPISTVKHVVKFWKLL